MSRRNGLLLSVGMILGGNLLLGWVLLQPITVVVNGIPQKVHSTDITVGSILQKASIQVHSSDSVIPGLETIYLSTSPIQVETNTPITISLDGRTFSTYSTQHLPANILGQLSIPLFPGDILQIDGREQSPSLPFTRGQSHTIQVLKARPIQVGERVIYSASESAGQIFWENGYHQAGYLLAPQNSGAYLSSGSSLEMIPRTKIQIRQNQQEFTLPTAGREAEQQLVSSGFAPQGLDTMTAGSSGQYTIMRVRDQMEMSPKPIAYTSQTVLEDSLALDQHQVIQSGEYGLSLQLTRIRSQDGTEINREVESETILKHPKDEITGYGTQVDVQTLQVGNGSIEYYRELSLYATSYSPCRSGGSKCSTGTASGQPARKGIVAVVPSWYAYMSGQQVYIPGYGYGVIGDTGGGIPGTNWIDLGYNDDDYVSWHSWVTVYFLTPVPSNILYTLQ